MLYIAKSGSEVYQIEARAICDAHEQARQLFPNRSFFVRKATREEKNLKPTPQYNLDEDIS